MWNLNPETIRRVANRELARLEDELAGVLRKPFNGSNLQRLAPRVAQWMSMLKRSGVGLLKHELELVAASLERDPLC